MTPRPFRNNLVKGDRVWDTILERQATVWRTPRDEGSRKTRVLYDGTSTPRYADVMQLRFIPPGTGEPEEVAPVDGEPPAESGPQESGKCNPGAAGKGAIDAITEEFNRNKERLARLETEMSQLRARQERLNNAMRALQA
jgi:hypothetical protein